MKTLTKEETRKVNGGSLTLGAALAAWGAGSYIGISNVISSEHKKYGHCKTYGTLHKIGGKLIFGVASKSSCY